MISEFLLFVLFHLQQPQRFLNALANPRAGITLEAYFSMAFGLCALVVVGVVIARYAYYAASIL